MRVDKARKRITKLTSKGFAGYPHISIAYFGATADCATEVMVSFVLTEGDAPQQQRFTSTKDVRNDETIQSVLIKIIDRANAGTVTEVAGVALPQKNIL
ncbi:hypothetical protein [Rheinheimera baltica]|uniref:hypothetical protein n=1 Tax=Rheinheimera baltica TaxID=67576 RepID=UPI00273CF7B4|nr:hypothetical protein [Rheinheimera baltica]MDP5191276.1 hypothetical protein [Rheinheimera baltica]